MAAGVLMPAESFAEVTVKTDKFLVEDVTVFEEPALDSLVKRVDPRCRGGGGDILLG